jgi:zinc and cadmium transporter
METSAMTITLGLFALAAVMASILGGLLPLATVLNHTRLQVYLSFSAGAMLGAAFFHMLPESVRVGSAAMIPWAGAGLLTLFFLERFFSFHQHEPRDSGATAMGRVEASRPGRRELKAGADYAAGDPAGRPIALTSVAALPWGSAAFGLAVHSLVGGFALASAVAADFQIHGRLGGAGVGVFLATLVHKPADALTITALMLRAGATRWTTHLVNLGFGLMIPVGIGLCALGIGGPQPGSIGPATAAALAFSAGTFLCIALSDLLPELHFHSHDRLKLSASLLAGLALMAGTALVEPGERQPAPRPTAPGNAAPGR